MYNKKIPSFIVLAKIIIFLATSVHTKDQLYLFPDILFPLPTMFVPVIGKFQKTSQKRGTAE